MRRKIIALIVCALCASFAYADITLPPKSEAFLPTALYKGKTVLTEKETNEVLRSKTFGQDAPPKDKDFRFWVAYSDRDQNTTYLGPSTSSGKHSTLEFNEKVRIAKIQDGYALVYTEPKEVEYPLISSAATSRGWVPMNKLLLWTKSPANAVGIYYKALLVLNLDKTTKESNDLGRMYKNPDNTSSFTSISTGMSFYFIMKRDLEKRMVLLAREYTLEGTSDQVLYGWVSESSYTPWNQRSCIEPNWDTEVVAKFKQTKTYADIYADKSLNQFVNKYVYGTAFSKGNKYEGTEYRMPSDVLRYPILDNDSGNEDIYKCTTFGTLNGDLTSFISAAKDAKAGIEEALNNMRKLNLLVVIDGTQSMGKYFPAVKEAVKRGCEYFGNHYEPRVGLVIYRDYADGDKGLVEYIPVSSPDDPKLRDFLENGGEYGVRSSAADRTNEEALFKGLETALDYNKMGYLPEQSNLMLVIGDCGNDENDTQCQSQEELIKQFIGNKVSLMVFQVRRNNEPAWLAFNRQMNQILKENIQGQYFQVSDELKVSFEKCTDGYDLRPDRNFDRDFFIGATRFSQPGVDMDPKVLTELMEKNLGQFGKAVQDRINLIAKAGYGQSNITGGQKDFGSRMDSAYVVSIVGLDNYKMLQKTQSLMAISGYSKKTAPSGDAYWRPVVFISSEEFTQLIERLTPVNASAKSEDRLPYINALKSLLRTMVPDITDAEMDAKGTGEVMNMINGLNEKTGALAGPTLRDIGDTNAVSANDFRKMIADFQKKYRNLVNIKNDKTYPFIYKFNDVNYYWIPIEEMP